MWQRERESDCLKSITVVNSRWAGIEDLCTKRDEIQQQIVLDDEEKQKIQNDIRILTERLAQINEGLARKIAARNDYDRTIAECETAYRKVCTNVISDDCHLNIHVVYKA